jgi:RNA polymerase primary sigma factor
MVSNILVPKDFKDGNLKDVKLLEPKEEIKLAYIRDNPGRYTNLKTAIKKIPGLSVLEKIGLEEKVENGNVPKEYIKALSKNILVSRNIPFFIKSARDIYFKFNPHESLQEEDLIQAGLEKVLTAAEKYYCKEFKDKNKYKEIKFISYADFWLKSGIYRHISEMIGTIRMPANLSYSISLVKKAEKKFINKYGYKPTLDEINEMLDLRYSKYTLKAAFIEFVSIDESSPFNEEGDERSELIPVEESMPEDDYRKKRLNDELSKALDKLESRGEYNGRDRKILEFYYGLNGKNQHTLEEIGILFNISRERANQLRYKSLRILKKENPHLKEFFYE